MARYSIRKEDTETFFPAIVEKTRSYNPSSLRTSSVKKQVTDDYINTAYLDEEWKTDAMNAYNSIPEVGISVDLTAKMVASCTFDIKKESVDGTLAPTEHVLAEKALRSLKSEIGGQHQLVYSMAQNMQITGDGFLVGMPSPTYDSFIDDDDSDFRNPYSSWEFLSVHEFKPINTGDLTGGIKGARFKDGITKKKLAELKYASYESVDKSHLLTNAYIVRIWRPSPHFSALSDCALRKNLILCKELLKLTDVINAASNSRLNAGMLLVPDELSFGPDDPGGDDEDPLTEELLEYVSAPVADRSSAASLAPMVMRGKAEFLEKVEYKNFGLVFDAEYRATREELIHRLLVGLDIPIEVVQGKSSVNHWTGHAIESEFASKHIIPLGDLIASRLTVGFLRPMLVANGVSEAEASRLHITFNPSNILARADKESLARKLFEMRAISEEALIEASGFSPSDMPNANERRQRIMLELIKVSPMNFGPLLLPHLDGFEGFEDKIDPSLQDLVPNRPSEASAAQRGTFPDQTNENDPRTKDGNQTPNPENQNKERGIGQDDADTRHPTHIANSLISPVAFGQLITIIDQWRKRSITLAANRVISKSKSSPEIAESLRNLPKPEALRFSSKNGYIETLGLSKDRIFGDAVSELDDSLMEFFLENQSIDLDTEIVSKIVFAISSYMDGYLHLALTESGHVFPNGLSIPDEFLDNILSRIEEEI